MIGRGCQCLKWYMTNPKDAFRERARGLREQRCVRTSSNQLKIQAWELKRAMVSLAYALL